MCKFIQGDLFLFYDLYIFDIKIMYYKKVEI